MGINIFVILISELDTDTEEDLLRIYTILFSQEKQLQTKLIEEASLMDEPEMVDEPNFKTRNLA